MTRRTSSLVSSGQHGGQMLGFTGAHGLDGVVQIPVQHLTIKEKQGGQRLVLHGGGDVALHRQVGEEGRHFGAAELAGMAVAVVADEPFDPIQVGPLRADGIVLHPQRFARLVEERGDGIKRPRRPGRGRRRRSGQRIGQVEGAG